MKITVAQQPQAAELDEIRRARLVLTAQEDGTYTIYGRDLGGKYPQTEEVAAVVELLLRAAHELTINQLDGLFGIPPRHAYHQVWQITRPGTGNVTFSTPSPTERTTPVTNPDYTFLTVLADISGSMNMIKTDAEGGIKSLITEQRAEPGKLDIALFEFDDSFAEVTDIDGWHLRPRGSTALLDAIGKSVTIVGERLAAMPEDERPGHVVFAITTDGYENASHEWTQASINQLITQQREQYGWQFVYTAAGQDAVKVAKDYGIPAAAAGNFVASAAGAASNYGNLSRSISAYRGGATSDVLIPDNV